MSSKGFASSVQRAFLGVTPAYRLADEYLELDVKAEPAEKRLKAWSAVLSNQTKQWTFFLRKTTGVVGKLTKLTLERFADCQSVFSPWPSKTNL